MGRYAGEEKMLLDVQMRFPAVVRPPHLLRLFARTRYAVIFSGQTKILFIHVPLSFLLISFCVLFIIVGHVGFNGNCSSVAAKNINLSPTDVKSTLLLKILMYVQKTTGFLASIVIITWKPITQPVFSYNLSPVHLHVMRLYTESCLL